MSDSRASFLAFNLRKLRAAVGMSQAEIAERAGLSRVGYRNLESGVGAPRLDTLESVARAFKVDIEALLAPAPTLSHVRFRSSKKLVSRAEVLVHVAERLAAYAELEHLLGVTAEHRVRDVGAAVARRRDRPRAAAEAAREAVGLAPDELIRDICGLLEHHGVKVLTPSIATEGFFGLSVADEDRGPAVVINTWERISVERQIFSAAHELGHLILHLSAFDVGLEREDEDEEREADRFASYFLMPADVFWREWRETRGLAYVDRVFKLKRMFRVSYQTILYRLQETAKDPGMPWTLFLTAHKRRTGKPLPRAVEPMPLEAQDLGRPVTASAARRADEPERLVSYDFMQDRLYSLVHDAYRRGLIDLHQAARFLALDLPEMEELAVSWSLDEPSQG